VHSATVALTGGVVADDRATATADAGGQFFREQVEPILREHCYRCHSRSAEKQSGGLWLDSPEGLAVGGDSGAVVVPGHPEKSLLVRAVNYADLEMPPDGKLPAEKIAVLQQWIARGAVDPRVAQQVPGGTEDQATASLWSLEPVVRPRPPQVADAPWVHNAIDRFILRRLEEAEIEPVAPAGRTALLRRVYFDLIGLPPAPQDVERFLADESPAAFANLVDRLLASPQFGERWGRHWMDVVRYADSVGGGGNLVFDNAWRYRDEIIRAINEDRPYDRFLMQQIAGDLLPASGPQERSRQIIATGFLAIGRKELPEYDKEKLKMDVVDEQIDTVGKALLGLSLGCARCHDHKFDPVSTTDYYALAGIFESTQTLGGRKGGPISTWVRVDLPDKSGQAIAVHDVNKSADARIRIRGDAHRRGDAVPRGFVGAITDRPVRLSNEQSGRLELARWIASADNPLTARVMVNRIWHWLFGRGLVATTDNFGVRGSRPTHPDLLDWLAAQFVEDGWSIKQTVRRIVLSRTYQLGSRPSAAAAAGDLGNRLCWQHRRRRLEAEVIRDAMLAISGRLDRQQYGKTLTFTGRLDESKEKKLDADPWRRRSVYLPRYREDKQIEVMEAFDAAHPALVTGTRTHTTVPAQALYLMNSPFVSDQALALAKRLLRLPIDDQERIDRLYLEALSRPASDEERMADRKFLNSFVQLAGKGDDGSQPDDAAARRQAWAALCQTILASNEFLFVQ